MKLFLILFLLFSKLVFAETFGDKCVTHGELKVILANLITSSETQKKLEENYKIKKEREILAISLRQLPFSQIEEKIRLFEQNGKTLEVESRCIFLSNSNYKNVSNALRASVIIRCAKNYKKMEKLEEALRGFQDAVNIVEKTESNEVILKEMQEIYKQQGNKQKEIEIKNILFD